MADTNTREWAFALNDKVLAPPGEGEASYRYGTVIGRMEYTETEVSKPLDRFYVVFDMADTDNGDWFDAALLKGTD